jgi:hypothetical protein
VLGRAFVSGHCNVADHRFHGQLGEALGVRVTGLGLEGKGSRVRVVIRVRMHRWRRTQDTPVVSGCQRRIHCSNVREENERRTKVDGQMRHDEASLGLMAESMV